MRKVDETDPNVKPIPEFCEFLLDRFVEAKAVTIRPDQIIVNEYNPGEGMMGGKFLYIYIQW